MYFQKDYILRMIEMLGGLAREINAIARDAEARLKLDDVMRKACGMPLKMLRDSEPDALITLLSEPQRFYGAEVLLIAAEVEARRHPPEELLPYRMQALSLFCSLSEPDYLLTGCDRAETLLRDALDELDERSLLLAAVLLERGGRFAASEDALFAAYDKNISLRGAILAFYDRIEWESDDALLDGRLSRAEIAEGRAAVGGS